MASTRVTYTQVAPTDNKKWTFSCWFKRAELGVLSHILTCYVDGNNITKLQVQADDSLSFFQWETGYTGLLHTNRVFRDVGAWYHVVLVWDSDNVTAGDRMKMYINGTEETSFATDTNPSSGLASIINANTRVFELGAANSVGYFGGEMSHVQFVDGSALAPTEFGEFDSTSGIWKIKTDAYATPGNNGVFLKMEDRTNLDLDSSSNAFTCTTGGTLTATYDSPSNNFCTMNPLYRTGGTITFVNGNTKVTPQDGFGVPGNLGVKTGKWYYEARPVAVGSAIGIVSGTAITGGYLDEGSYASGFDGLAGNRAIAYAGTGSTQYLMDVDSTTTDWGAVMNGSSDILQVAIDLDNSKLYFGKNGTWQNSGVPTSGATGTGAVSITAYATTPALGDIWWFPYAGAFDSTVPIEFNFGNGYFGTTAVSSAQADDAGIGAMEYDVPAGYYCLCTKNIKAYG